MSINQLSTLIRIALLSGIFGIFLWKFVLEMPDDEAFDIGYAIDLMADSGNLSLYPELDKQLLAARKILLTTDINANSSKFVVASLWVLNQQDPSAPIDLLIRTNGGYLDDAFAIVDTMRMIDAPVNTYALGGSHSSGTMIVASGTGMRAAYPNAIMMVHDNLNQHYGDYNIDDLENKRLIEFWQSFPKIPRNWFSQMGDEMNYINPQQALEMGIVDLILKPDR